MACVSGTTSETAAVDKYIVERYKGALDAQKPCSTELQRKEYRVLLRGTAPHRRKASDKSGMLRKVAKRLEIPYGYHKKKSAGRTKPYAFTQDVVERGRFDDAAKQAAEPRKYLAVGDTVLCRGQLGTLSSFDPVTDECSVTFVAEHVEKTVHYLSRFGNEAKSARLQRPPPLLMPPPRQQRKDKLTKEIMEHVATIYETNCPTSPHQRDRVRRLLASRCWEPGQAMIQSDTLLNLYSAFGKEFPEDKLGYTKFKMLKPWNLKKTYRAKPAFAACVSYFACM